MKAGKIVLILLIPLIVEITTGCCNCDAEEPTITRYVHQHIQIDNLDNSGIEPVVTRTRLALKEAYGIRVWLFRDLITHNPAARPGFMSSAYAFGCDCGDYGFNIVPGDSIVDISVTTLEDFDTDHPAGANIADLFRLYNKYRGQYDQESPVNRFITLRDYIASRDRNYRGHYIDTESIRSTTFDMFLMEPPTLAGKYHFNVRITLSDGRLLEQETGELELR